jgi:hemerythrin superfamily protein
MATWEDLDSESGSDKDDAEDEANVVVGLVATVASDVEPKTDSEDENEIYSKIPREQLIESLKELLTHFENRTKDKYVDLMKQQKKTLLDLKESEEGLRGFDFICKTYEDKLKYLCQQEKCEGKPLSKQEIALEDFIISGINKSKVVSMIYSIYNNNGKGIGFS